MFDLVTDFEQIKKGFFYCLLGGDRPIIESLLPNRIDQRETMIKQFSGMTEVPFSYSDYEENREKLIDFINSNLTQYDKEFLIAFEAGNNLSQFAEHQEYLQFPSVQWKLQNINTVIRFIMDKRRCPSCGAEVYGDPFSGNSLYVCEDPACRHFFCGNCRGGGFVRPAL